MTILQFKFIVYADAYKFCRRNYLLCWHWAYCEGILVPNVCVIPAHLKVEWPQVPCPLA